MIDFKRINAEAVYHLESILPELLPGGRIIGREYNCGDLTGGTGDSMRVNLDNGKWADFADTAKGGDVVSLVAAIHHCDQGDAARWLESWLGIDRPAATPHPKKSPGTWTTIPAPAPPNAIHHPRHGKPSATWEYRGMAGELLGFACRFDQSDGGKEVVPYTYGKAGSGKADWRWKSWPEPRPLYGLDRLAQRPDAPILIIEGEKTTDAAQRLLPAAVAVSWPGGSNATGKADFSPLKGRRAAIWPDNDEPGRKAAEAVARAALAAGAGEVFIVEVPPGKAEAWDLADAEAEGWTPGQVSEWIKSHRRKVEPADLGPNQAQPPAGDQERGHSWPEPLPLIVHEQAASYPLDALPETIGAAVREVVGFVQCPVALGACSALSVVSTVGQGLVDVRRAAKLEGPTSLFLLAVADSGERKTTVDGFFSKPVQQWEAERAEAAKPELNRFRSEDEAWAAKKSGLLTAIKDTAKAGKPTGSLEQNLIDLESNKPEPPKVPRLLYGDATPEALAHRLAHEWPVGGVLSSEAGAVFGSHGMKSDSAMRNMAMLNSLWGAEPLTVDRRSENGSFTLRGARLTMGLAVQSETVRAFLDGSKGLARGIGWLARFLVAWPESTQGGRMFKDPPEHWPCLAKFHRRLGALLDHPLAFNDRGELEPETLELSPEAKAVWVAFHDDVEAELKPGREMAEARDVASKAADNAARLAGLFRLFENDPGGTIGADHMRRAAAVAGWHLYEARRFLGEIALPVQLSSAAKLDAWLLEHCRQNRVEEISTRDAQRLGPNCTREKGALVGALQELTEAGRVQIVESKRRRLVKINPALLGG